VTIHLDIGGEGRHVGALNVNPLSTTSTGPERLPIPNLVHARGEQLPFASGIADLVTVENTPIRPGMLDEIQRVLRPGGELRLLHPVEYALGSGVHDAVAATLDLGAAVRTTSILDGSALTVLRRGVGLLR
jgi:SAM-dependent methyltransferase